MRVLITGIAGFYGHHLASFLEKLGWEVIGIDKLDEGGSLDRLSEVGYRGKFFFHDLRAPISGLLAEKIGKVDVIFHLAAMSHVDRSIKDPIGAVLDNVLGTARTLEFSRETKPKRFVYFSTDEVYGPRGKSKFKEWDRYHAGSPYSATKAGGEELALAYHNTYGVPVIVTHCMNIFGERQHPEKFIPKVISHLLKNEVIPIYSDKTGKKTGARSYIYVDDVSTALMMILYKGKPGDKYNIEGSKEVSNLDVAKLIADEIGVKLKYEMVASDSVRPGNDFSYGIDGSKVREMGFTPKYRPEKTIKSVVQWYLENQRWLKVGK